MRAIKEYIQKMPPRYACHLAGILSVIVMVFMIFSLVTIRINTGKSYEYSLLLFIGKLVDTSFTIAAWLATLKFAATWRIPCAATTFFIAFCFAVLNLVLALAAGGCYLILCPSSEKCAIIIWYKPIIFVPGYSIFQGTVVLMLLCCTNVCNKALPASNSSNTRKTEYVQCKQYLYFLFGRISSSSQLSGIFFTLVCIQFLGLSWHIHDTVKYSRLKIYARSVDTYNHFLMAAYVFSKLLLTPTAIYGFKRKKSSLLTSSIFISALSTILGSLFAANYLINDSAGIIDRDNACRGILLGVAICYCEFLSFRTLFLYRKRCKKTQRVPIEFSEKFLRIPASKIFCENILGTGSFGEVWLGKLLGVNDDTVQTVVAVKRLKASATTEMKCWFLEEALLLSRYDHDNIIKPVGLCMDSNPIMLCIEFLDGGSLSDYLHKNEIRNNFSHVDLAEITLQVAKACCYLETEGFIHRDIAARNCLISCQSAERGSIPRPAVVKLADFGLAKDVKSRYRNIYTYNIEQAIIPVPHTAPEGLDGSFHSKSDVWSFGVLVWEVFSWCARPFGKCHHPPSEDQHLTKYYCPLPEYTLTEIQRLVLIDQKTLLDLQQPCTASFNTPLRNLMAKCWNYNHNERPNFEWIKTEIEKLKNSCTTSPCFPFEKIKEFNAVQGLCAYNRKKQLLLNVMQNYGCTTSAGNSSYWSISSSAGKYTSELDNDKQVDAAECIVLRL